MCKQDKFQTEPIIRFYVNIASKDEEEHLLFIKELNSRNNIYSWFFDADYQDTFTDYCYDRE